MRILAFTRKLSKSLIKLLLVRVREAFSQMFAFGKHVFYSSLTLTKSQTPGLAHVLVRRAV